MGLRPFALGLMLGVLLCGCAGAVFPYKYYALDAQLYKGSLRGPDPKDDLDLEKECIPVPGNAAPCIVIKADEFIRLKTDYKDMQIRLNKCGG